MWQGLRRNGPNVAKVWRLADRKMNGRAKGQRNMMKPMWMRGILLTGLMMLGACGPAVSASETSVSPGSELYIRILKTTESRSKGVLQLWKRGEGERFQLEGSFDICTWSGTLGPKLKEGDGQSPEGFYFIKPSSLNPNSSYHLSFNLGFPNAFDRANGRTGSFLMVHGECVSIGCYAMTNTGIEEIYAEVEAAFTSGQSLIRVHIFPFEMTPENLDAQKYNPNYAFWENLKTGWDWFESKKMPPNVTIADKAYVFNAPD